MSALTAYADSRQAQSPLPAAMVSTARLPTTKVAAQQQGSGDDDMGKKKKATKRRKVNHACLYCRRSHMTCDEGRPCQRWWAPWSWIKTRDLTLELEFSIKRDIGHLCHDEHRSKVQDKPLQAPAPAAPALAAPAPTPTPSYTPGEFYLHFWPHEIISDIWILATAFRPPTPQPTSSWPMSISPYMYQPDMFGNEFSILTYVLCISFFFHVKSSY